MGDIIRIKKHKNFSIVYNEVFQRADISWKAKGIMAYLLTLPDDWIVRSTEIAKHSKDGKASFQNGWNELKELGYVSQERIVDEETNKVIRWQTVVNESVGDESFKHNSQKLENQNLDIQKLEFQNLENRPLQNTNKQNTNKQKTEEQKILSSSDEHDAVPYKEIVDYLNEKAGTKFRSQTKDTQKHIRARVNEGFTIDDFKKVIDTKTSQWLNDPKMNAYLRPATLFGTKFEGYLNEQVGTGDQYEDLGF